MLIAAGIREFVVMDGYPDELAKDMINEAGVKVRYWRNSGANVGQDPCDPDN
jgi:hypothetical protein